MTDIIHLPTAPDAPQPVPLASLADLPRGVQLYEGTAAGYERRHGHAPRRGWSYGGRVWWEVEGE